MLKSRWCSMASPSSVTHSALCPPKLMRRDAREAAEQSRKVALRGKTEVERQLGERLPAVPQQSERQANPPLIHEAVEAQASRLLEFSGEVAW